jgi:hypothetical protein
MNPTLARWLDDPDGGGTFVRQAELIRKHDPGCPSLEHVWLPRKGGYSCLTDSMECDVCNVTFFWAALLIDNDRCPYSTHFVCSCCVLDNCGCVS